ncbi:MAG: hypothetical protein ABFD49_09355 [Armatimonadota bacterium]|nr:DUF4352 domain-containing protein [bacterium]
MTKLTKAICILTLLTLVLGLTSSAATKKKAPAKKPASTNKATQGTTQLKGEYADFGSTYTLDKSSPLNITLKSAEYKVEPVKVGQATYIPTADEKLLVLHMTYHNPQKAELFVRWDFFGFTVVDPQDENHEGVAALGMEKDKSDCSMDLKPAQKIDVYGVMSVPANGEMPKLIIKGSDDTVLRYNLKGKVKGIAEPYVNKSDPTGATPLARIDAKSGTYYSLGCFDMKLDGIEYSSSKKIGEHEIDEDSTDRFLVVTMEVKNVTSEQQFFRFDTFDTSIIDTDGVEVANSTEDVFQKSKDKSVSADIQPGQEMTVRSVYRIAADTNLQGFSIKLNNGRTFVFDISSTN